MRLGVRVLPARTIYPMVQGTLQRLFEPFVIAVCWKLGRETHRCTWMHGRAEVIDDAHYVFYEP